MDVLRIATEDPNAEQWRRMSQFAYSANIVEYLGDHGCESPDDDVVYWFSVNWNFTSGE